MNNFPFVVPLATLVILIIVISFFVIFSKTTYQISEQKYFSFRNHFPHEIYYQKNNKAAVYFRITIIAAFVILLTSNILFVTSFRSEYSIFVFVLIMGLFFSLSMITSLILFILKPNFLKQFKIYSILTICFNIMGNGMLGFLQINNIYSHAMHTMLAVFAFILVGVNVLLVLNPKLKDWDKLEESRNSDGTISYVRPKISWLAFSLWISFLTLLLGQVIMLISMTLSSLNI